ncbi:TraR/DksA family transcriptional regulator [Sulfurimonas sp.]
MNTQQRQSIKEKIIVEIASIQKEIVLLEEKSQPITPDCSLGRLTRQEMMLEQQVYLHTLEENQKRLNRLKFALSKVENEDYGECKECEEDIAYERLLLVPESAYCVNCLDELNGE